MTMELIARCKCYHEPNVIMVLHNFLCMRSKKQYFA